MPTSRKRAVGDRWRSSERKKLLSLPCLGVNRVTTLPPAGFSAQTHRPSPASILYPGPRPLP